MENKEKTEHQGTKNLIPVTERTKEEQKKIVTKGGIESGKARRKKRDFIKKLELVEEFFTQKLLDSDDEKAKEIVGEVGYDAYTIYSILDNEKSSGADKLKAISTIIDRKYGKPKQTIEQTGDSEVSKALDIIEKSLTQNDDEPEISQ